MLPSPQAGIHRDLKPANLMLGGPKVYSPYHKTLLLEEMGIMKIADFGLSKSLKLNKPKNARSLHSVRADASMADAGGDMSTVDGSVAS